MKRLLLYVNLVIAFLLFGCRGSRMFTPTSKGDFTPMTVMPSMTISPSPQTKLPLIPTASSTSRTPINTITPEVIKTITQTHTPTITASLTTPITATKAGTPIILPETRLRRQCLDISPTLPLGAETSGIVVLESRVSVSFHYKPDTFLLNMRTGKAINIVETD